MPNKSLLNVIGVLNTTFFQSMTNAFNPKASVKSTEKLRSP